MWETCDIHSESGGNSPPLAAASGWYLVRCTVRTDIRIGRENQGYFELLDGLQADVVITSSYDFGL